MPFRRVKSCINCRRAKARCSLATPCSRCAARRLDCQYTSVLPPSESRRTGGFRFIRPAVERHGSDFVPSGTGATSSASVAPARARTAASTNYGAPVEIETTESMVTERNAPMQGFSSDLSPQFLNSLDAFDSSQVDTPSSQNLQTASDMPASFFEELLAYPYFSDLELPAAFTRTEPFFSGNDDAFVAANSLKKISIAKSLEPQLSQRVRSIYQGSLTAKILFSRLSDYSHMMADSRTLPPFIYPPCHIGPHDECAPDSPHRCLPEALAVCCDLTYMFYSQMPDGPDLVWQQICTHLRQMQNEVSRYHIHLVI